MQRILHEHFDLRFKKMKGENIKYNDPGLDGKRVWVSRLLAQFLFEDVLIVSIDESGFQQSLGPAY